ncbi:putative DEAD/DEAH box helicase [Piedraia hortae CBS 480.64]|uniref:Putative DEAD/DEAH box helicase n=1 Tax=Piedraia hortae CBS 480.64 TaxID=1314780 RepID=A0A6A7BV51_9PEZI|nr:putative DEAD/DEAH box helicase [Piedraia hortae CBS 480.64]
MGDFSFSDDRELQQLNAQTLADPDNFDHWEKLVRAAEAQEGGLNRNSSPQAITAVREVYDRLLARFPLFFGYWKKYADLEFVVTGPEAAELVYERGIASIGTSVDLWANYCAFKTDTWHDMDAIRELFERGVESAGLDFLAHPLWDKYLEFEDRCESPQNIFKLLGRIIHIPLHQYARYFERYRSMAATRPVSELAPESVLSSFGPLNEVELRQRLDAYHVDVFQKTQAETTKRWTYEQEIKRPYYHVTELDSAQLTNWRRYLDFEEAEGDYTRIKFLYERCLVTCANYDEFWFRYARWMQAQGKSKSQEVRNIYARASALFIAISRPAIRLYYAYWEEAAGNIAIAMDIHHAILSFLPNHVETIISMANVQRRTRDVQAALQCLDQYMHDASGAITQHTRGAIVAEQARLLYQQGDIDAVRKLYSSQTQLYQDSAPFWLGYLDFEAKLTSPNFERVKAVYDAAKQSQSLSATAIRTITARYFSLLRDLGGKDAMSELASLDVELNGPRSVRHNMDFRVADDGWREETHNCFLDIVDE